MFWSSPCFPPVIVTRRLPRVVLRAEPLQAVQGRPALEVQSRTRISLSDQPTSDFDLLSTLPLRAALNILVSIAPLF